MHSKKRKLNVKRVAILLLVLFIAIVTVLTVSSKYLNDKATESATTVVPYSNSVILTSDSEEKLQETIGNKDVKYTQIDNNTYVVKYSSAQEAKEAVTTLNNAGFKDAVADQCFVISGITKKIDLPEDYTAEKIPEGMTLREYADSAGKKIVAVIDTGVDDKYATMSKNFTSDKDEDVSGHGTMVAKSILSNSDDKAIILSIKAMGDDGTGYMSNIIQAVQYAREQHVDIINMSIITDADEDKAPFKNIVESAISDGITVVAAAGNYQSNAKSYYPAGIDGVISVGAMDDENTKTVYSNYNADYYEEADSTSEASAILTGKLASGNELNEEISNEQVTVKDEDKAKEDQKIVTINKNGEFEVQSANQAVQVRINNVGSGFIWLAYNGSAYQTIDTKDFNLGASSVRTGVQIAQVQTYEGYVPDYITISGTIEVNGWSVKDGTYTNSQITSYKEKDVDGAIMAIPSTSTPMKLNIYTRLAKVNVALWGGSSTTVSEGTHTSTGLYSSLNLGTPTRNGYKFLRWKLLSGGGIIDGTTYYYGTSDGSIASEWGANVMLDPNGGTLSSTGDANIYKQSDGSYMINPRNQTDEFSALDVTGTRDGYKFKGFYTAATGGTQVFKPNSNGTCSASKDGTYYNSSNQWIYDAPTRLYAQWEPINRNLTLDANGGTVDGKASETINGLVGSTITKTASKSYKVTLNTNGHGTLSSNKSTIYATVPFGGWQLTEGNATISGNNITYGSYDSTVKAKWNESDTKLNDSLPTLSATGYDFDGWYTSSSGGTKVTNSTNITSNMTLYAHWTAHKYKVAFNKNSGRHVRKGISEAALSEATQYENVSGTMSNEDFTYDSAKNLTSNGYSWPGHKFLGWSTDPNATKASYTNGQSVNNLTSENGKTVTLYAIWEANTYTLSVDPNGGGTWLEVSAPTNGTDAIHNDGAGNTKWGDKIILGNAQAYDRSATVTYDVQADDAGVDKTSETVRWVFNKWDQVNGSKGRIFNNSARDNNGNHDGGQDTYYILQSGSDTVKATYYFQTVTLPNAWRDGYTFLGWYEDPQCTKKATNGGNGTAGATYRTEQNITLYARWQKNSYSYADEEQVFMQDKGSDSADVFVRKIDATTGEPLVEVNGEPFILGIYKNSVSSSNLVLKIDTLNGVYNASGTKVMNATDCDTNGWYRITDYIQKNTKYVVHEEQAAPGYNKASDQTFTFDGTKRVQISVKDHTIFDDYDEYTMKLDKYGRPIANATFQLKDETTGKVVKTFTTNERGAFPMELDKNGKATISMFNYCIIGHRYSLTETKAPDGFTLANTVYFDAVPGKDGKSIDPVTVLENTENVGSLKIKKVDHDDNPLQGATFQLFMKDSNGKLIPCYMNPDTKEWIDSSEINDTSVLMTATSGEDGIAEFKNLPLRANFTGSEPDCTKSYYLKEIHAPQGYNLLSDIFEIRLSENNVNGNEMYTVKDDTVTLTLETGGNGNKYYMLVGTLLITIALGVTLKKKNAL